MHVTARLSSASRIAQRKTICNSCENLLLPDHSVSCLSVRALPGSWIVGFVNGRGLAAKFGWQREGIDVERVYHPGRERKTSRPGGRNPLFCLLCLFAVRSSRMAFHQQLVTVILHVRRSYASPH